jgi:hypothetical protein
VTYSRGVLGAARISVNYSKDDIKAREEAAMLPNRCIASFRIRCLFLTLIVSEIPEGSVEETMGLRVWK